MHLKSILTSLIILGFLAGCTFLGNLPPLEATVLAHGTPVAAQSLKVAYLGSDYSSSASFLSAVSLDDKTYTIWPSDGWKIYLPLIIKSTPALSTQTPTPTATSTPSPTLQATPTLTATQTPTPTRTLTVSPGCTLNHNGAFEQQLYVLINDERANADLGPLTINYALEISAGLHSDDMAINHFMSHIGSDGSTFWERALRAGYTGHWGGEIIMGGNSPESAVAWWMSDAPHRDMILGDLNDFGAGYAHCSGGYFTVDFGHR